MKKCFDDGTLQAWFDGELDANAAAGVAAHLHGCIHCTEAARTIEVENLILSRELSAEFGEAVPTERLRQRVQAAVAGLQVTTVPATSRSWINTVRDLLPSFRVLAYASIAAAILIAGIFLVVNLRKERSAPSAENGNPKGAVAPKPQTSPEPPREFVAVGPPKTLAPPRPKPIRINQLEEWHGRLARESTRKMRVPPKAAEPDAVSLAWPEGLYQNAFAKLDEAIKAQAPLRPALRVEYEYNLAVIDNAIINTREIARKNPKDPLAAQSMLAAYQSKIDLMNQLAQGRISEQ